MKISKLLEISPNLIIWAGTQNTHAYKSQFTCTDSFHLAGEVKIKKYNTKFTHTQTRTLP